MKSSNFWLFLDDEREPLHVYPGAKFWDIPAVGRTSAEAIAIVLERGMPSYMSLDHDLGGDDTSMEFLKWLANVYYTDDMKIPFYYVHSENPIGRENIKAFMRSWKKSTGLPDS